MPEVGFDFQLNGTGPNYLTVDNTTQDWILDYSLSQVNCTTRGCLFKVHLYRDCNTTDLMDIVIPETTEAKNKFHLIGFHSQLNNQVMTKQGMQISVFL